MNISFDNKKLEKILTNDRLMKKNYQKIYKRLMIRLSEIQAAENLSDISQTPPPRRHKLEGNYADCWGIDADKNVRIVLRPVGEFDINDLESITEISIVTVEDYH